VERKWSVRLKCGGYNTGSLESTWLLFQNVWWRSPKGRRGPTWFTMVMPLSYQAVKICSG